MIDIYIFKQKQGEDYSNPVSMSEQIHNENSDSPASVSVQMSNSQTLLRTLLVKKYHLHENQTQIAQNEYGKPYIIHESSEQSAETLSSNAPQPRLHFSITHAGETTLIAISDQPIGIDAEQISELSPDSISHFLSPDEYAYCTKSTSSTEYNDTTDTIYLNKHDSAENSMYINQNNDCTAPLRTLEVWTKKEAISKYLGYGLNMDFSSFSVFDKNANYSLATFVKDDMVISLCTGTATDIQQLYCHTSYIEKIFSLI